MSELDEMYTDLIMEHSMNSPYKKNLDNATCSAMGHNASCGDEIKLELIINGDIVEDIAFMGKGCAISQSATSIMIETLQGKTVAEAKKIIELFIKMIQREQLTDEQMELLQNSIAFQNVANMPARVKCALLSWHTMQDMLNQLNK